MNLYELVKQKREEILKVADKYGAYNVRIFGSVARKEANENSDIDLLVDLKSNRSLWDLGGLWIELNELLKVRIEVFTASTLKEKIRENALSEAIKI